jgi:hypothetical protein
MTARAAPATNPARSLTTCSPAKKEACHGFAHP